MTTTGTKRQKAQQVTVYETIPPAVAKDFLKLNVINRPMRKSHYMDLANVIREGLWEVTHQGIAFDEDGLLRDGQHRLMAIVESGIAVTMAVTRGMSSAACDAIDNGKNRTFEEIQGFKGNSLPFGYAACLRGMFANVNTKSLKLSNNVFLGQLSAQHDDVIRFALESVPTGLRGLRMGQVTGVIARAAYSQDKTRLREFGRVYMSGLSEGRQDEGAIRLRNWRLKEPAARKTEVYRKAEAAVYAFLHRQTLAYLQEREVELFPLPGEKRQAVKK